MAQQQYLHQETLVDLPTKLAHQSRLLPTALHRIDGYRGVGEIQNVYGIGTHTYQKLHNIVRKTSLAK